MSTFVKQYAKYLLLAALMYMPIFGHLDTLPIRIWDEARLAMNAYEMSHNGNWIVTYHDGQPDMWNTKPPFLIWIQVLFVKALGFNELAMRLPSAIAVLLTCGLLLWLSVRYMGDFIWGAFSVMILLSSRGFLMMHAGRSCDYDAMLTFWSMLGLLSYYMYIERKEAKFLYVFFGATTLAVLTKSVSGLFFLPTYAIYTIWQGQLMSMLKSKHTYIGAVASVAVVAGYYLLREAYNPGYLAAVQLNELGGRFMTVIEEHKESFWYYYQQMYQENFKHWFWMIPCGALVGLLNRDERIKRFTGLASIGVLQFFWVISSAQTKLEWYAMPLYPILALICGLFMALIYRMIAEHIDTQRYLTHNALPYVFVFVAFIAPYKQSISLSYMPKEHPDEAEFYAPGYFLQAAVKGKRDLNNHFVCYEGYNPHLDFYMLAIRDQGMSAVHIPTDAIPENSRVITHQTPIKTLIDSTFVRDILYTEGPITCYQIHERKK